MTAERLLTGVAMAAVVSWAAFYAGSLTARGALAATFVGGVTFGAGGPLPAFLLVTFFVTSSLLSRMGAAGKKAFGDRFEKSARRDEGQVLANGGLAALLSLVFGATGGVVALAGLAGALAAVTADTWATEVGVLAGRRPVRIVDGRRVEPGTSGAISLVGSLAAVAGAGLIAGLTAWGSGSPSILPAVVLGGVAGATVDSLLGATVQAMFECPACRKETERHPLHSCGAPTRPVRGWPWLRNDAVNAIASGVGALVAASFGWVLRA